MTVAVIGAGPTGLAMVRNLRRRGFDTIGFEIHSDVGGLWDIDSPTSTMYETAHLISSKRMTEFAEFPMAGTVAPYPHHREVRAYFQDYAKHFGLYDHYEFETEVVEVAPADTGWTVTTRRRDEETRRRVDRVVIATGTFHHPNVIDLPGRFDGDVVHSSRYRSPDLFAGKRVLVIGCGNSGADIAVDAVHRAASVDLSVRRGYHFVPKFAFGRPIDTIGGRLRLPRPLKQRVDAAIVRLLVGRPSDYGLPDPDYRMYESHPVLNTQVLHHLGHGDIVPRPDVVTAEGDTVRFADGSSGRYDLVLTATGYHLHYPFIDPTLLNWRGHTPQLYLNTFHPHSDDLAVAGMVEATGLGWEGRNQQARLIATYFAARDRRTPSADSLRRRIRASAGERIDGGYRYLDVERMAFYVEKDGFLARIRQHLGELESDLDE